MPESLPNGLIVVYFLCGLALFVMGLTIALESAMTSRFRLVPGLWLLAAFGILNGLSEWFDLIIALEAQYRPTSATSDLSILSLLVTSAAFGCLFQFSAGIFLRQQKLQAPSSLWRLLNFALWLIVVLMFMAAAVTGKEERHLSAQITTRYGLVFVGSLVAAYALSWQSRYFRESGRIGMANGLSWGAVGFAAYAVAAGAIVPKANFWPASQFNEEAFRALVGVPVEAVQALLALLVAVAMIKTFVIENRRALESAHQHLATLNESMKAITSSLNLDAVLRLIIQEAAKASAARGGVLLLSDPGNQDLLEKGRYGLLDSSTLSPDHPTCRHLYDKAKEQGRTVLFDPKRASLDLPPESKGDQLLYLCAPITMSETTMGALLLARQQEDYPFNEEDVQLVAALAREAAVAIENAKLYHDAWEMTITDALTALRNYRYLHGRLQDEVTRAARYDHPFSIIAADCDSLKRVNDGYGHRQGDRLLQALADIMRGSVRASDAVTRQAGDEFVILLPETACVDAVKIAERIRRSVEGYTLDVDGERVGATMSFGVCTFPDHAADAEDLLLKADKAMYTAKLGGKNRVAIYEAD